MSLPCDPQSFDNSFTSSHKLLFFKSVLHIQNKFYVTMTEECTTPHLQLGWGPEQEPGRHQAQLKEGGGPFPHEGNVLSSKILHKFWYCMQHLVKKSFVKTCQTGFCSATLLNNTVVSILVSIATSRMGRGQCHGKQVQSLINFFPLTAHCPDGKVTDTTHLWA